MGVSPERRLRAVGRRVGYGEVPVAVRDRVRDRFGAREVLREHEGGMFPGLCDDRSFEAVAETIRRPTVELAPPPAEVVAESLAETALRWSSRWTDVTLDPGAYLPAWAAEDAPALAARVQGLPASLQDESLCQFDIRDDNLLLTTEGDPVVLDWGNPRLGPAWTDAAFLAAQRGDAEAAVTWLDTQLPVARLLLGA